MTNYVYIPRKPHICKICGLLIENPKPGQKYHAGECAHEARKALDRTGAYRRRYAANGGSQKIVPPGKYGERAFVLRTAYEAATPERQAEMRKWHSGDNKFKF